MTAFIARLSGGPLRLFWLVLLFMLAFGPVTAWGANMVLLECAPVAEGEAQTCTRQTRPKDLAVCQAALSAMKASGSAKQIAQDQGDRAGWLIQILCESTPLTFTVPGG